MSEWKIPQSLIPFAGELCPKGTFVECKICSTWDDNGKKYGNVRMQKNFWFSHFTNHIRSARHKANLAKEVTYKQVVEDHDAEAGRKPKWPKQWLLSFAPFNPSNVQIRNRIVWEVCHRIASGSTKSLEPVSIISVRDAEKKKESTNCNSLLAKKDLSNF